MSAAAPPASRPDAILLLGPTASGKSAAAMAVARERPVEIVSVDSALVYRGMDVGTAKPSAEERRAVPHHLIDLIEPTDAYSAAAFATDARRLIGEIRARGRLPLLVGGTMLYAKALADGLDELPPADPAVRTALDADAAREGWPAMHARLARIDPASAARLEPGDSQRIQRALEVHALTGRPMSALLGARAALGAAPRLATIALEPSDRAVLHARIAARFDAMLAAGFIDEVRALRARGDLAPSMPSMRCVGYRQAWSWLDDLDAGDRSAARRARFVDEAVAATRQLAKRQLTWLRAMPTRVVVDCLAPDVPRRVSAIIAAHER
ncbi:MAG: tRNA (adenosine(37)-N6)-dimethylallyltransferase MiaA [Burkholderiales bacterium]|jgi:tRNA dimethylallyltransferase